MIVFELVELEEVAGEEQERHTHTHVEHAGYRPPIGFAFDGFAQEVNEMLKFAWRRRIH